MGPRRLGLFLCLAAVLALAASFARPATAQTYNTSQPANCSSIGGACPANAPCCRDGYCDSSAYFCGVNCEPLNSFSLRSCFARFPCYSYRDDFDGNKTRLVNAADWDGNPLSAEWISLFQPDNAYLNNSKLVLRVLKKKELNSYGRPEGFGASVATSRWIEYGTVEARFRTAKGAGIVSAFIVGMKLKWRQRRDRGTRSRT